MVKFYRKLRYDFMNQNKAIKYLKYAFGEIVLVVIGILLALQVNNWNIGRNNAKEEIALLKQLENEYSETLREVDEKIFMRTAILSSISQLFFYIDNGITGVPLDTVRKHVRRTYSQPTFDGPDGVTSELLNSGKLYLINNSELRIQLSNWKNTVQKMLEEEQLLVNMDVNFYYEYMRQHFNSRKMGGEQTEDKATSVFLLSDSKKSNIFRIPGVNDESEYKKYLNDPAISSYLISINSYCRNANIQANGLKKKIERILEIIHLELKSKVK